MDRSSFGGEKKKSRFSQHKGARKGKGRRQYTLMIAAVIQSLVEKKGGRRDSSLHGKGEEKKEEGSDPYIDQGRTAFPLSPAKEVPARPAIKKEEEKKRAVLIRRRKREAVPDVHLL